MEEPPPASPLLPQTVTFPSPPAFFCNNILQCHQPVSHLQHSTLHKLCRVFMLVVVATAVVVTLPPSGVCGTYTAAPTYAVLNYRINAQSDTPLNMVQLPPSMLSATHCQHLNQYYNWQHPSPIHHTGCNSPDRILRTALVIIGHRHTSPVEGSSSADTEDHLILAAYPWTSCDENKSKLPGIISAPWKLQEQPGGFAKQDELKTSK